MDTDDNSNKYGFNHGPWLTESLDETNKVKWEHEKMKIHADFSFQTISFLSENLVRKKVWIPKKNKVS